MVHGPYENPGLLESRESGVGPEGWEGGIRLSSFDSLETKS
jgi:hypothetical protein